MQSTGKNPKADRPSRTARSPYDVLHIYYLQGRIAADAESFGPAFIGNWIEDDSSFLFFSEPSHRIVETILKLHPAATLLDTYRMTYEQWHGGRSERLQVGRFIIDPPWIQNAANGNEPDDRMHMFIDPGVVFGTGLHPTTRDCIEALDSIPTNERVDGSLDLGSGTGVLAVSAAMLGFGPVLAVDNHFIASAATRNNVSLNHLENRVLAIQGEAKNCLSVPADLLIANIHYDVMKPLIEAEDFLRHRWFVLSGLMRSQAKHVESHMAGLPVTVVRKWESDGIWFTYLVKRKISNHKHQITNNIQTTTSKSQKG